MSLLARVFASSGTEVIIPTLEIVCPVWETGIYLCNVYEDQVLDAGARIAIVFRHYLSTDLTAPTEPPLRLIVQVEAVGALATENGGG